ncbi:MAG: sulfite exporter TauE/SafE family protein [Clostridia bacterium]|nr:sulfite exporter TauE/SafE family protein [Clostridia bacterium]
MKNIKNILWGIPIGFINGFFGSGGGVIAVLVLRKFLDVDDKRAHATALGIILPLSCASLFMYKKAEVDFFIVLLCAIGGAVGSIVGAKMLNKIPKKWLKIVFGTVMILSGVRMVL